MEVEEQVGKLVRFSHVLWEDGSRRQTNRVVIRSVLEGTQHGWLRLVGTVGSHVQEEVCHRLEEATSINKGKNGEDDYGVRKRGATQNRHEVRRKDCVWPSARKAD